MAAILPPKRSDAALNTSAAIEASTGIPVDDLPWRWGDFSDNNTIVVVGLPSGQHKVLIELADPEHRVFTGQAVTFTVPGPTR